MMQRKKEDVVVVKFDDEFSEEKVTYIVTQLRSEFKDKPLTPDNLF